MATEKHVTDLIAAYALNCLEETEIIQVENHLATCVACRLELTNYQDVVDQLALGVPDAAPSPEVERRLLARIRPAVHQLPAPRSFRQQLIAGWRALMTRPLWQPLVLLVLVLLAVSNLLLWQQLNQRDPRPVGAFQAVMLQGTADAPEASGLIIISNDRLHGTLIVQDLPPLATEQEYQLWLIRNGQRTSGAVFSVSDTGYRSIWVGAPQPLDTYPHFGVTIEPAGGSPAPTGARVLGTQ